MTDMDYKNEITAYFNRLKDTIDRIDKESLSNLMNILVQAKDEGKQIFIMGNGGSSATASHYVCDFNKGISYGQDKKFKMICLNDNVPSMMAYSNDLSFTDVFVHQLSTFFNPGDIVIGISGSGNSANVVKAFEFANENCGVTVALTGYDGGKLKRMAKHGVHIPVNDMQIAEDLHMVLDHCMMKILSNGNCGC